MIMNNYLCLKAGNAMIQAIVADGTGLTNIPVLQESGGVKASKQGISLFCLSAGRPGLQMDCAWQFPCRLISGP